MSAISTNKKPKPRQAKQLRVLFRAKPLQVLRRRTKGRRRSSPPASRAWIRVASRIRYPHWTREAPPRLRRPQISGRELQEKKRLKYGAASVAGRT